MDKVLITGGAGFIGSHLSEALLAAGREVLVLDDLSTGSLSNIAALQDNPHAAYQAVEAGYHQRCLPHLLSAAREIRAALELLRPQRIRHPRVERFLAALTELLKQARQAAH
jgi:nucleoside-diphosphate-sugar epimerase